MFVGYGCTTRPQASKTDVFEIPTDIFSQTRSEEKRKDQYELDSLKDRILIDPMPPSAPYRFKYHSFVELPDSLGGDFFEGNAIISGCVNSKLEIVNLELKYLRLSLKWDNSVYVEYIYKESLPSDLFEIDSLLLGDNVNFESVHEINSLSSEIIVPPEVSAYFFFFEEHIKNTTKITRTGSLSKNENSLWHFRFPLRFGKKE